jgi:hypothetical protein
MVLFNLEVKIQEPSFFFDVWNLLLARKIRWKNMFLCLINGLCSAQHYRRFNFLCCKYRISISQLLLSSVQKRKQSRSSHHIIECFFFCRAFVFKSRTWTNNIDTWSLLEHDVCDTLIPPLSWPFSIHIILVFPSNVAHLDAFWFLWLLLSLSKKETRKAEFLSATGTIIKNRW